MKIYIITIHCIHNFGSVFQSYGLVKYLNDQGYDAKIIDYRPAYYRKGRNQIRKYASIVLNPVAYFKQYKRYLSFIKENLPVSAKVYYTIEDLAELKSEDAIFIAGGDQIWNSFHPCGKDDAYKLTFASGKFKLSYGTSMGRNSFTELELEELRSKIEDFQSIGLREQTTVPMLQPYSKCEVYHAADPVLLLEKEDYMQFIGQEPLIKEPYLLMYLANSSSLLDKVIEYMAQKKGLKVVHVCGFSKKCRCDFFLKSTGPTDLLNLIYYSYFVVSASFHATLFSILLHKQFCTLLPEAGTNTRIEDALSFFHLDDRIIRDEDDLKVLGSEIEFSNTDSIKENLVKNSKDKLIKIIEQYNDK